ncbi:YHS domain-containing protein [Thermodesulfatator indicus DSM 15286]|uniref:YHS domain-containing protein n=1 Tax=Thermodesulfatator indicus (strain DSM 15286 / JCM 11887 / CIR29812) TaxID=667014 RepID=F8AC73_THEID|nr:YHS domain-containing protein [Thermodesulfatator indicus]AEH44635.1 YHS domain-containing protein [Thermodesulfatator indicus DSM 15286]
MFRIILIIVLFLLIWFTIKAIWKDLRQARPKAKTSSSPPEVTDKLVKDPVCGVYCPRKTAYTAIWQGKVYYFCSEECRQKFLAEKGAKASSSG